jgi:hypothetical protein
MSLPICTNVLTAAPTDPLPASVTVWAVRMGWVLPSTHTSTVPEPATGDETVKS